MGMPKGYSSLRELCNFFKSIRKFPSLVHLRYVPKSYRRFSFANQYENSKYVLTYFNTSYTIDTIPSKKTHHMDTTTSKHIHCFVIKSGSYNEVYTDIYDTHINIEDTVDKDSITIGIEHVKDFIEQITAIDETKDAVLETYSFGKEIEFSLTTCALLFSDYSAGTSIVIDRYKINEFCNNIRDYIG